MKDGDYLQDYPDHRTAIERDVDHLKLSVFGTPNRAGVFDRLIELESRSGGTMSAPRLRYFDYDHLPPHLQRVAKPFKKLASKMLERADVDEDEISMGLRKLVEAKDCFVRAHLEPPTK